MSYLRDTSQEMKERTMNTFWTLRNAKTTDEVNKALDELEKFFQEKLLESFNNGRQTSGKQKRKNKGREKETGEA